MDDQDRARRRSNVTALLAAWNAGDQDAINALATEVYGELHAMAQRAMQGEQPGHTLQATALVHEAFLRLVGGETSFNDRVHFFAVASQVMRRILVDHARSRTRTKRGGDQIRVTLGEGDAISGDKPLDDLIALDDALSKLSGVDERKARVIEMLYFGGLTHEEVAEALGVSTGTVFRDLRLAKAWLFRELH